MLDKLKEIIKKVAPEVNTDAVTSQTRLVDDLAFDSLSMMLLSLEIEEAFDCRFPHAVRFETVGDVLDYLKAQNKEI